MFVRIKRIKGQDYGYLVENSWTERGPRQKVTKYLGKILRPGPTKSESLAEFAGAQFVDENDFKTVAKKLIELELSNHDIDDVHVNFDEYRVMKNGRNVVIAMHEGFVCGETIKRLLAYVPDEDYSGFDLADRITGAGIKIEKDVFVALFEKLQHQVARQKAQEQGEFYY